MHIRFILGITILVLASCSLQKTYKYPMPYLNSIEESKSFTDSLRKCGIDKIIVYHKKHGMSLRQYYIFWIDTDLQLRNINANGIFKPNWEMIGFYRNARLFEFFQVNRLQLHLDSIPESNRSHYPYSDIQVFYSDSTSNFHLPYGIQSTEDLSPYHFARLIESTLFNIERRGYWQQAEKKLKYYPKNYDPQKQKWQLWKLRKIRNGEIWDDYYH